MSRWFRVVGATSLAALVLGACAPPPSAPTPPSVTVAPEVTGSLSLGATLAASTGEWSGNPTSFSVTWQTCDAETDGTCADVATGSTYQPVQADVGRWVQVTVAALNAAGEGQATSNRVGPVTSASGGSSSSVTVNGETLTATVAEGQTVTIESADPAQLPAAPAGLRFPYGALDIEIAGVVPGGTTQVTLVLPGPVDVVRKFIDGSWDPFTHDGTTGAALSQDGRTITLDLLDGGRGDADGIANGVIVDPFAPGDVTGAVDIATSYYELGEGDYGHSCAVMGGGTVKCWGSNQTGWQDWPAVHGEWFSSIPIEVTGVSDAVAVTTGFSFACVLTVATTVECWGQDYGGQLGGGTTTSSFTPVEVVGLTGVTAIAAGYSHTCALLESGSVKCWGSAWGGLGDGSTTNSAVPVDVVGVSDAVAISSTYGHTCVVLAGGTAKCWGSGETDQLGDGVAVQVGFSAVPVDVVGISDATAIAAGDYHTCALLVDGTAQCWGFNSGGQLGSDTGGERSPVPLLVAGLTGATAISAGQRSTCALTAGGTAKCWGSGFLGQLGNGSNDDSSTPVDVAELNGVTALAASTHSCALLADGTVKCWGLNYSGELGNGESYEHSFRNSEATPVDVIGLLETLEAPDEPEITKVSRTGSQLVVEWNAPPSDLRILRYDVSATAVGPDGQLVVSEIRRFWYDDPFEITVTLTDLIPSLDYTLRVSAVSAAGIGPAATTIVPPD
jgi:alpha-tubulin suppressor-like RCC1 family protein